jgi:hypothetical protein
MAASALISVSQRAPVGAMARSFSTLSRVSVSHGLSVPRLNAHHVKHMIRDGLPKPIAYLLQLVSQKIPTHVEGKPYKGVNLLVGPHSHHFDIVPLLLASLLGNQLRGHSDFAFSPRSIQAGENAVGIVEKLFNEENKHYFLDSYVCQTGKGPTQDHAVYEQLSSAFDQACRDQPEWLPELKKWLEALCEARPITTPLKMQSDMMPNLSDMVTIGSRSDFFNLPIVGSILRGINAYPIQLGQGPKGLEVGIRQLVEQNTDSVPMAFFGLHAPLRADGRRQVVPPRLGMIEAAHNLERPLQIAVLNCHADMRLDPHESAPMALMKLPLMAPQLGMDVVYFPPISASKIPVSVMQVFTHQLAASATGVKPSYGLIKKDGHVSHAGTKPLSLEFGKHA